MTSVLFGTVRLFRDDEYEYEHEHSTSTTSGKIPVKDPPEKTPVTNSPRDSSDPVSGLRRRRLESGAARLDLGGLFCGAMAALTLTLLVWGFSVALARAGGERERLTSLLAEASLLTCGAFLLSTPVGIGIVLFLDELTGGGDGAGRGKSPFARRLSAPRTWRVVAAAAAVSAVGLALGLELASGHRFAAQRFGGVRLHSVLILSAALLPQAMLAAKHGLAKAPSSLREASLALGATPWQTLWMQVLPAVRGQIALRLLSDAGPLAAIGAVACAAWQSSTLSLPAAAPPTTAAATAGAAVLLLIAILLVASACGATICRPTLQEAPRVRRA